jgi:hypothetical protein
MTVTPPPSGDCPPNSITGPHREAFVRGAALSAANNCYYDCPEVFINVRSMPTIKQGTLIEWDLHPNFRDPGPYEYQLQFGRTGNHDADDWTPVGGTANDVFFLIDDEQRVFGKTNWAHYRICLTTATAQYFSKPIPSSGSLPFADRAKISEIIRAELTMFRTQTGTGGAPGALLKRKLFGTRCDCVDDMTEEITNPDCELCYGTGFAGGYYEPVNCTYAALDPNRTHNNRDGGRARGTVDEGLVVAARMIAVPQLFEEDVWVDPSNDNRWYIHEIRSLVEWRGTPVVISAELRFAPFSDPIYSISVPALLPEKLAL